MAAKKYNLNIPEFDGIVEVFVTSLGDKFSYTKTTQPGQIIYHFKEIGQKKDVSILTCYNSQGRTSFNFGGTKPDIAQKCSYKLIEDAKILISESKTFTIKPASDDEVETIINFLTKDCGCKIEELPKTSKAIKSLTKIVGCYNEILTLTHYTTGTLMLQGRPSMAFISFIDIATELFNPAEIKREHLKTFDITEEFNIINSNLSVHLPNAYSKIGAKMDAIMAPSLILLNSPKDISDYTAYAFPILRGAEGALKMVFFNEGIPITNNFVEYFTVKYVGATAEWAKDCSSLFPNALFRKSLLDLYSFYHKERHTLCHMDATIDTSRTLNYNDALDIVKNGLKLVDEVYKYLN